METSAKIVDYTQLIADSSVNLKPKWRDTFARQREITSGYAAPDTFGTIDTTRWSRRAFRKAMEYITWDAKDLMLLIWDALRHFLQRVSQSFGVKCTPIEKIEDDDPSKSEFKAKFEGTPEQLSRVEQATSMASTMLVNYGPNGEGALYHWAVDVRADVESEFFKQRNARAYGYLATRVVGLEEYLAENKRAVIAAQDDLVRRSQDLIERTQVTEVAFLNMVQTGMINKDRLPQDERTQRSFATVIDSTAQIEKIGQALRACLVRAREAGLNLPEEMQLGLLQSPELKPMLIEAAQDPQTGEIDPLFAAAVKRAMPRDVPAQPIAASGLPFAVGGDIVDDLMTNPLTVTRKPGE